MKLYDILKALGCELVEVTIPVADGKERKKRFYCDAADLLLEEDDFPRDAEVDEVSSYSTCVVTCFPYNFPPMEEGTHMFDVRFSCEEMEALVGIADGWRMTPPEVVQKIVKDYLKSIEEE